MAEPDRNPTAAPPRLDGARFLIVEARFYDAIGEMLLDGARRALAASGASCDVVTVPGALEIPVAMAITLDEAQGIRRPYDGAIALGCVIRGATYHFEIVCNESARALTALGVERRLALGNGILTVETQEQALERADPARLDKGGDAARAALALCALKRRLGAMR
jgi:6,7-dimethyl-8-ribityllumazine synthase